MLIVAAAFRTSTALASAYGMAVTVAMSIDGLLAAFIAARWCWCKHKFWLIAPGLLLMGGLFVVDLFLIAACALKVLVGAWLPLAIAVVVFTLMTTWARGCQLLLASIQGDIPPLRPFITWLAGEDTQRTGRTAVYLVSHAGTVPRSLLSNLKHNKVQVRCCGPPCEVCWHCASARESRRCSTETSNTAYLGVPGVLQCNLFIVGQTESNKS